MSDFPAMRRTLLTRLVSGEIKRDEYEWMMREIAQSELETIQSQRPSDTDPECIPPVVGHSILPGMKLGVYKIRKLLGKGGIGEVWLAWEEVGGFYVVIKTLPPLAQSPESMKAVLAVFHRVRQLQHQHICPVYTLGFEPKVGYFFAMKYVEGITVDRWLQKVPVAERTRSIIPILQSVAAALDYSHSRRVIHRDIKPQNVMISEDGGDVQVIDFGLAAQVQAAMSQAAETSLEPLGGPVVGPALFGGTPAYMAPEQWNGRTQDARTDQYSLGVVAYELIRGQLPFGGSDPLMICVRTVNDPVPEIPGASSDLQAVLCRALAKKRAERFDSCSEFVTALATSLSVNLR